MLGVFEMTEINRRPLLKAIGATIGAGTALGILPKSWTRPVVHSVIVPAHAAASPGTTATTTGTTGTVTTATTVTVTTGTTATSTTPNNA